MYDKRKFAVVIKILVLLISLLLLELTVYLVYSYEIENRFYNKCRENIKFIIAGLEITNPNVTYGEIDVDKLKQDISSISSYYKIDRKLHLLVFRKNTGLIIYPRYSKERKINTEIEKFVKSKVEQRIETGNILGYYFYYKPSDISFLIYRSKKEIFFYRNILLLSSAFIFFILIFILTIVDIRKNKEDLKFLKKITDGFKGAFDLSKNSFGLREIEYFMPVDKLGAQLIQNYNRMVKRINILLQRQDHKIRELGKQRSNLRKLAYYYKKYSSMDIKLNNIDENFVEKFSNKRISVVVLSLELINYFKQIREVYPEVINRELESLYRYINSIIKNRNGILNYFEGNYFNIVFGLIPESMKNYSDLFNLAVLTAKDIHSWILDRNRNRNYTGVSWKEVMGISCGNGIAGVIGSSLIVIGEVVESSKQLMQFAEKYIVSCITDSEDKIKGTKFKYRTLDRFNVAEGNNFKEIYEIFLEENKDIDDAIKLYHHGLDMYFEENYEIATVEFKKVNQLLKMDNPSLIFLERINSKDS